MVHEQTDQTSPDAWIAVLATRQHGVVSWRQLLDAGFGRGAIDHRCRIGWLHRIHRGVFAVGHPPLTREARWMGAVLACGDGAGLSHACATALWEIRPYNGVWIDVTVPSRGGRSRRERVRVHRSCTLRAEDVTTHRGIPVTTVARTLLDVAATLSEPSLARTVEQTEIRRLFDLKAVDETLARNPITGVRSDYGAPSPSTATTSSAARNWRTPSSPSATPTRSNGRWSTTLWEERRSTSSGPTTA